MVMCMVDRIYKLKAFVFKTPQQMEADRALAELQGNDPEKVRKTHNIIVHARPLELLTKRRCIEFQIGTNVKAVVHSRELLDVLASQGFQFLDVRVKENKNPTT